MRRIACLAASITLVAAISSGVATPTESAPPETASPTTTTTPDPSWEPSPGAYPRDIALAWCQFSLDLGGWAKTWSGFAGEPPDLATVRATVPGILAAERPAAETVRADLAVLSGYEPTGEYARTARTMVDAIEATLEEFGAATEATDLGALTTKYQNQLFVLIMFVADFQPSGVPENCSALYPPSPTPVPTAAPVQTPRVSTGGWRIVDLPGRGWISGVVPAASGYLAVGGTDDEAAAWTSPDCLRWSRVKVGAFRGSTMASVTVGGPGFVAVGKATVGDTQHAAVWTSRDGLSWSRVPDSAVFASPGEPAMDAAMYDVAASGRHLVAVGAAEMEVQPAIWTSSDGVTWRRPRRFEPGLEGGWGGGVWLNGKAYAVTSGGPGFVAVGDIGNEAGVWYSTNGLDWEQVPSGPWSEEASMSDVASAPDGSLIAVGSGVWTSPDGKTWSRVRDGGMSSITSSVTGWVAVGSRERSDPDPSHVGAIWSSIDGRNWALEPTDAVFDNAWLDGVFVARDRMLVMGEVDDDPDNPTHSTWARALPRGAQIPTPPPTWTSPDTASGALTWVPVSLILGLAALLFGAAMVRRRQRTVGAPGRRGGYLRLRE